jgi:dihydropteroate synthase type 2
VSVDSFLPDIQGFRDEDVYAELAAADCRLVVMHSVQREGPATKLTTDPAATWASIERFFDERLAALEAAGIGRERLIIDPGLGYFLGSNPEPSLVVLARIRQLRSRFDVPVGTSSPEDRILVTSPPSTQPGSRPAVKAA